MKLLKYIFLLPLFLACNNAAKKKLDTSNKEEITEENMKKKKVKEIGITALYERLSRDDDGDGDSNSIVHQKQMLEAYAKEHLGLFAEQ